MFIGVIHLFGWGQRPVNRYKAYDCFCRAHSAGCAAAANNRAVCKRLGYGCKQNVSQAETELLAVANSEAASKLLKAMALVWSPFVVCASISSGCV